jgi:hypothetical protein
MNRLSAPLALLAVVAAVGLAATACAREDALAPTTTTGTALPARTSLPPVVTTAPTASTTTTAPPQVATEVNACALLAPEEVQAVTVDDPGPGTPVSDGEATDPATGAGAGEAGPPPTAPPDPEPPTLFLAGCTWPTDADPLVTLSFLAPTTATSGLDHLQRMIDLDTRFARGARAFPLNAVDTLNPAALVGEDGTVIEVAVVNGSALLYVVPHEPPPSGTPEAEALVALLVAATSRAPA